MAAAFQDTGEQLEKMMECSICLKAFTDPRILPCIHTFCLQCLEQLKQTRKKKQRKFTCPICRKMCTVPASGVNGLPKNFFMENLKDMKNTLQLSIPGIACDICQAIYEGEHTREAAATMRCLECRNSFCDFCSKAHKLQVLSKDHHIVKIGSETETDIRRLLPTRNCPVHKQKPLDFYCADCRKILCVSCFVENHALHKCKDVTTVEDEFRQTIQTNAYRISTYADKVLSQGEVLEWRKESVLSKISETEREILSRNLQLKEIIDKHTLSLLEELTVIKETQMKVFENEKEEVEGFHTILKSFETYCNELSSKGSASDVCGCVNDIVLRVEDLANDHNVFLSRPFTTFNISFEATDLEKLFPSSSCNIVGRINEATTGFGNYAVVVGTNVGDGTITQDVVKINLQHPYEVSHLPDVPARMRREVTADVCDNTVYVSGIGVNSDEIWKYNFVSGWMKCASLVQGRRRHSAAFIDEVLYICGGIMVSDKSVLDSVEAYNAVTDECVIVGNLAQAVESSGNCLPYNSLLYIFGGSGVDRKSSRYAQVYNTENNTCTMLSNLMPRGCVLMRAVLWETSVILLGRLTCFLFNFETETWREIEHFKTGVDHFGLVLESGRIFVFGGGFDGKDVDGKTTWKCRDDVMSVPVTSFLEDEPSDWTIHTELPMPALVQTYSKMTFPLHTMNKGQ